MKSLPRAVRRHARDIALWLIFAASVLVMLKTSTDPSPAWAKGTWVQRALSPFSTGNQVAFDVSVGLLVSLLVYVLVVRVPERAKRKRLKNSLGRQYIELKEACIMQYLFACDGSANLDLVSRLLDQDTFKRHFKEVLPTGDRWMVVVDRTTAYMHEGIVQALATFRRELEYTLTAIDIDDPQVFAFLRHVTRALHSNEQRTDGYDDRKALWRFLWSLHTGWDWVHGYTGKDEIARAIEHL